MLNKQDALETLILEHEPDLIVITETWLSGDISDAEIIPPGYSIVRQDRSRRGGGVVKQDIDFTTIAVPSDIEAVWITITLSNRSVFIGGVYRAPNTTLEQITHLRNFVNSKFKPGDNMLLLGDFNLPDIDWNCYLPGETDVTLK